MKTKILALGFSLAFLLGNAVNGEQVEDPQGPTHTLKPFVVFPHTVKLLNDQKMVPIDYEEIVRKDVDKIVEQNRQGQLKTMIVFHLETIMDISIVAAAN